MAAGGAAIVGAVTIDNPQALPTHGAAALRLTVITSFAATAIYAQRDEQHERMGQLLGATTLFCALWLLNGASRELPFSVGALFSGSAPVVLSIVMLAQPTGRLRSGAERRFVASVGGVLVLAWTLGLGLTGQPLLDAPLVHCAPRCSESLLSLRLAPGAPELLRLAIAACWVALPAGTAILLVARARSAPLARARCLTPVSVAAAAQATLLVAFFGARAAGLPGAEVIGVLYAGSAVLVPLAIALGLMRERLFMGDALAGLVAELARRPGRDPQAMIARTLRDPSLRIAYKRPGAPAYVDASGASVELPPDSARAAVSWIRRGSEPIAAVVHAPELAEEHEFIQAIGAAALIRLEKAQLEAELRASTKELEQSRVRLLESAHAERRRIERDLHDGVQQQLVGARIKLDIAAEAIREQPACGERELAAVGRQLDDVLQSLRSLARGIYPAVLHERGLAEAMRSVARNSPIAISVRAEGLGRFAEDIEVAVYFCCLEAIQNVVKHAGASVSATIALSEGDGELRFEVRDGGAGFDPDTAADGTGTVNMRDRIEAIGGRLRIFSSPGRGTVVRGGVPVLGPRPIASLPPAGGNVTVAG